MCGGAIISDFIAPTTTARSSRRLTSGFEWFERKPLDNKKLSKPVGADPEDDFEADFQGFKDESDVEEDYDVFVDAKPSSFSAPEPTKKRAFSPGNNVFPFVCCSPNFSCLIITVIG